MSQEETTEILTELLNSIKTRGLRKTLNLLKSSNPEVSEITEPYDNLVIDAVCEEFKIDREDLIRSKYMRGEMKYAVGMAVHFLYKNKSIGEIQKRIFVHKNKTLLSKYRQLIFDLDPNFEQEWKILFSLERVESKIETYKQSK